MTATCTPRTEEVILSSLKLTSVTTIRQTCDRPNISLIVQPKKGDGKEQATNMIVNEHKDQCGIVYCTERATTLDMTYCLQTKGVNVHAGIFSSTFLLLEYGSNLQLSFKLNHPAQMIIRFFILHLEVTAIA